MSRPELLRTGVEIAAVLAVTWAVARFSAAAAKRARTHGARRGVSLIGNLAQAAILTLGLLIVLDTAGVRITGIVTALGISGVAVGLALQDTLSNFFAGLRVLVGGQIRPGDFIRLDNGLEGTVHDITWSQTTVFQSPNNLILVPNSKLAASVVVNFSLPDQAQNFAVPLTVSRGSDLAKVEQVTMLVARETLGEVEEAVKDFEPMVRFDSFGEAGINVNVILRARHYNSRGLVIHAFIRKLVARYRAEGIDLGAPLRTVISKDAP